MEVYSIGRPLLILSFIFLATMSSIGQELGFRFEGKRKKVVIDIEVLSNLVIVPVTLNGIIPLKFILDTGVRTTVLTKKEYADLLGLTYSRKYTVAGLGEHKSIDAFITNNVSLSLPGIRGVGHSILALKEDYLKLRNYLGAEVHGILGYELFSRFIVKIDYGRETLTLMLPDRFKPKKNSQALPISIQDTKPYIYAAIQSEGSDEFNVKLLIDTGASHGLFIAPNTHELITIPKKNIRTIIGRGLGGLITGRVGRMGYLKLGTYIIDNPVVHFLDTGSYASDFFHRERGGRNGALGGAILNRFIVTFNFPKGEMYLRKNSTYRVKSNYDMSGLTIKVDGPEFNNYKIVHLVPQSPGDLAGLEVEDRIIAINGKHVSSWTLNRVNGLFSSQEGRRILLRIEREGKQMNIRLRLAIFI